MKTFKKEFLWGAASAAYQIEGAFDADGKQPSIWDVWSHIEGKTFKGTNGDVATDHYHRWQEDIEWMKQLGMKAYRFSISWPRVWNHSPIETGMKFYDDLIDGLLEAGIEPVVTLYHWDLPQSLQATYGGWESRRIVDDFVAYAEACFNRYGDRVKHWIVMNEPNIFTHLGYIQALHPPGKSDEAAFLLTFHHTVLAHAKTVLKYKEMGFSGNIGSSIAFTPAYAKSDFVEDTEALENYYATGPWWFMDSYFKGEYPKRALEYYQNKGVLFDLIESDFDLLKSAAKVVDFMGINYYQTAMIAHNPVDGVGLSEMNTTGIKGTQSESGVPGFYKLVKNPNIQYTDWDWAIDPEGLCYGLVELTKRYALPIIISENGLGAYDKVNENGEIADNYRIAYLSEHVRACSKAVSEGVDLFGYMIWSFTDLLSWLNGYQKRYGLVYIDFEEEGLRRIPKASFKWYKKVIESNGEEVAYEYIGN